MEYGSYNKAPPLVTPGLSGDHNRYRFVCWCLSQRQFCFVLLHLYKRFFGGHANQPCIFQCRGNLNFFGQLPPRSVVSAAEPKPLPLSSLPLHAQQASHTAPERRSVIRTKNKDNKMALCLVFKKIKPHPQNPHTLKV